MEKLVFLQWLSGEEVYAGVDNIINIMDWRSEWTS